MGLFPLKSRRLMPAFRDFVVHEVDLFALISAGVRCGLAADPNITVPRDLALVMNTGHYADIRAGARVMNQLLPRAGSKSSTWEMGDSRAEVCLTIAQLRSLVNSRKTEMIQTSLMGLDIDAVRGRSLFAPDGMPSKKGRRSFQVDKPTGNIADWNPSTDPQGFSAQPRLDFWDDYLTPIISTFAKKSGGDPLGFFSSLLGFTPPSRNVGVFAETALYSDYLRDPGIDTARMFWPMLSGIRASSDGKSADVMLATNGKMEGFTFLRDLTALHLALYVSNLCGNAVFNPPDEPGEDKADAHRKRRRRQVLMFYSLGLAPFIATDALFDLFISSPLVKPHFDLVIERGGYGKEWESHSAVTRQYHAVAPSVAAAFKALNPARGYFSQWEENIATAALPLSFLQPLLFTISSSKPVTARDLTNNYLRVAGRYAIRPDELYAFIQDWLVNRKMLARMLESSSASTPDSLGGAWSTMSRAIGFVSPSSGSEALRPSPNAADGGVLVTNGVMSGQPVSSLGEFMSRPRITPICAFGVPAMARQQVNADDLESRVAERSDDMSAGTLFQDFMKPLPAFIEVRRFADEEVGGAAMPVNPREYMLVPLSTLERKDSAAGPAGSITMDFIVRYLGDDVSVFPNTLDEWASRLGLTRQTFTKVVNSSSELWTHLFEKVEGDLKPRAGMVVSSSFTQAFAHCIAAEVPCTYPDEFIGFEKGEPQTAALREDLAFLRDARDANETSGSIKVSGSRLVDQTFLSLTTSARQLLGSAVSG